MRQKKHVLLLLMMTLMSFTTAFAQKQTFTGVVVDEAGEPVIGASVVQKGTTNGSVTDLDGNFRLQAENGTTFVISFVGYATQEVKASPNLRITLKPDAKQLDEVVVVGYGVQKKSVVTAAIAKVSSEDLAGKAPVRIDNALKGLASGVTVTAASGAPGEGSRVRVRGVGTINNSDPLYIVDGMPIEGTIDYLNPSDIESIEVLKDAASGAVYGARAANGVILVTTKSGKKGKVSVNYNFSQGWQTKWRKRDVLNATEYAVMMNEGYINAGMAPKFADPYAFGAGTNWQDEIFNDNAPVSNHELSISGASDKLNYYLSLGYYSQDGIVGGDKGRSNYRRLSLRSNTKYNIFDDTKDRSWLNKLDLAVNVSYSRIKSIGFNGNAQHNGVLASTLTLSPLLPVSYSGADAITKADEYKAAVGAQYVPQYDENGNLYMIPGSDYDTQYNPVAFMAQPGRWDWTHKYVANFAADLQIGFGFKYRFSYGADMTYGGWDKGYTIPYYLNGSLNATKSSANAENRRSTVWQIENVLTWDGSFDKHNINVVLGQSAKESSGWYLGGSRNYLVDVNKPYISYAEGHEEGDLSVYGGPNDVASLASLFARASYNYDERYMAQFTIRRDGSSRFGSNNHYATFPSFSLGWNAMNEKFMEKTRDWLSNLKVRFSWGKNGNENIGNFRYAVYTQSGYNAALGRNGDQNIGVIAGGLANPDLKWEESVQTDFGLDFGFFNNSLTFTVDYFIKKTDGMLMDMPVPAYMSNVKPVGNVGEMKNSGVEFELGYKWHIADAKFGVKANASYLKNELVKLGNDTGVRDYDNVQGIGVITRAENGEPFPFFYGYKTAGIFQNQAEVDSYVNANGEKIQPNAVPGDFRWVDVNGDGKIDGNDQTKIGKGMPDWTFGLNVNAEWRGFDFNMFWQGTAGNDIYDATMRVDRQGLNLPSWMLDRWTGEGSTNEVPRYVVGNTTNLVSSDLYVRDGSYLRLKNISLGYTVPQYLTKKAFINSLRVYVMAENLLTFTKYHGYDPEISSGGTSLGVDYGVYPQSRTWTIGFNLGF